MATFENTVTIRRSPKDVFAFLANFENIPTWNYAISETKKTSPGPVGVGTTYRQLRSIPSRSEEGFQVTVFEPPRDPRRHRTLHRDHQLPTGADERWDPPDQRCRPRAILRATATRRSPGRLQGPDGSGGQPRHAQATPGNTRADVTSDEAACPPVGLRSLNPTPKTLGLPRSDGQGWWLGQATCVRASWRLAVSNSSGVM